MHVTFVNHDSQSIISMLSKKTMHVTFIIHDSQSVFQFREKKTILCM